MIQILNTTSVIIGWNSHIGSLGLPLYHCHIQQVYRGLVRLDESLATRKLSHHYG